MNSQRETEIIEFLKSNNKSSSKEISDNIKLSISYATLKRLLTKLKEENKIETIGQGKATKYIIEQITHKNYWKL